MGESLDKVVDEVQERAELGRLNGLVALFVALVATVMALCNVKDGNVVQAMQQAQARSIDQWAYYQAKSTKEHLAEATVATLQAQLDVHADAAPAVRESLQQRIADWTARGKKLEAEKAQIKKEAEDAQKEYDRLNVHDDQFDLAEACLSVAVALAGVTALTQRRWLFVCASAFATIGLLFALAGFMQWHMHSDLLAKVLG